MTEKHSNREDGRRIELSSAVGLFLFVTCIYVLTAPGRIDTIDGQYRYTVAKNWYSTGQPEVNDPALFRLTFPGLEGRRYSAYNAPASLFGIPLIALADLFGAQTEDARRFSFTLVTPIFGGALAAVLFIFYRRLGAEDAPALRSSLVASFCTLIWPVAASAFDQVQHAFFIFVSLFLAHVSSKRRSLAAALLGGMSLAMAIAYQENYALLAPFIALAALSPGDQLRSNLSRYAIYGAGAASGLMLWASFNFLRTGQLIVENRFAFGQLHPPMWGNPLDGAVSLLASPGRGILFFSPIIILAIAGLRPLHRRAPQLVYAICGASLAHFCLISSLSFFSGEWCWGPRYLIVVLALLHLGLPFAEGVRRRVRVTLVAVGIMVQLLGLSLETSRFHYEHRHSIYFWANRPLLYFHESQLISRPREILATLLEERPAPVRFRPGPYPNELTWAIQGVGDRSRPRSWLPYFRVFYLPRPWPLWMPTLSDSERFLPSETLTAIFSLIASVGAVILSRGIRARPRLPDSPAGET